MNENKTADDKLVNATLAALADVQEHDHPVTGADLYCLNLTSWMGERMGPILGRLHDVELERDQYRDAVLHMLALAADEYRTTIVAARAAMSTEGYDKNNGRAEMIRVFATGLAERAGLPVTDWEQIKQGVPSDGVYR